MKNFIDSCKLRPLILWILLGFWFVVCTALCIFVSVVFKRTWGPLLYTFLSFPIAHLIIYVKPLNGYNVVEIICMYLILATEILAAVFSHLPLWIFIAVILVLLAIVIILLKIEIDEDRKKSS